MFGRSWLSFGFFVPMLAALLMVIAVACGSSATSTTAAVAPVATVAPAATDVPAAAATAVPSAAATAVPIPTAVPTATSAPVVVSAPAYVKPYGTLDFAEKELGVYQGWPGETGFPQWSYMTITSHEGLFSLDGTTTLWGRLAKDWSTSADGRVWTINLREGVPFHDGVGELTAEDVIWSHTEMAVEGSKGGTGPAMRRLWQNPDGYLVALDDHTIEVDTGQSQWDLPIFSLTPGGNGAFIVSKSQALELEAELGDKLEVNSQGLLAGTGPWEKVETRTGEWWKMKAFEDHWRKVPFFEELIIHELPEEATRVANFQVGKIDFFAAAPDGLGSLAEVEGTKFMSQQDASQSHLSLHGQYYWHADDMSKDPKNSNWAPEIPYVSSNPDPASEEWARAVKVRKALGMSINRDLLIEELLNGEGRPLSMWAWMGHDVQANAHWKWDYDVEQAKQLLAEAGYPDGFELEITAAIRGAPAEEEICEAIGDMWADIGVTAHVQNVPYTVLRQTTYDRSQTGIFCHAVGPGVEPNILWGSMWSPDVGWTTGLSHKYLTSNDGSTTNPNPAALEKIKTTFDPKERWEMSRDLGDWLWDNALDIGLYTVNVVYVLGPEVDPWTEHLQRGDARRISALEWAPHRQ